MTADAAVYGTAVHAAREALDELAHEGYVNSDVERIAEVVVDGLRARGFMVSRGPRCECGWTGVGNHSHDARMGRAADRPQP